MGTETKAAEKPGAAELAEKLWKLRAEHEEDLRQSHEHLSQQLAEIAALEYQVEGQQRAERAMPLIRRGLPLARHKGWGRPTESKHPFPRAVGNVLAWARANGLSYGLVKSWFSKTNPKPIHRRWATLIERTYGIPATAWRGGVSDVNR